MTARFGSLTSTSAAMQQIFDEARRLAGTSVRIFILGESGTGKTALARAIHDHSPFRQGEFVDLDVSTFSESVLESELFGHVRGAFTGAVADREGVIMMADGGTLFLDELANVPRPIQAKLLKAVATGTLSPVGSKAVLTSQFRLICATNVDVKQAVRDGTLLADLVYRAGAMTLKLPPLRDRPEDIALLANQVVARHGKRLSPDALALVLDRTWPGNVRELLEHVDAACAVANGVVQVKHVRRAGSPLAESDPHEHEAALLNAFRQPRMTRQRAAELLGWPQPTVERRLRALIHRMLIVHDGNQSEAARALDWGRSTLQTRMRHLGIEHTPSPVDAELQEPTPAHADPLLVALLATFQQPRMTSKIAARQLGWSVSAVDARLQTLICQTLEAHDFNQSEAARALDWGRTTLRARMRQLGIHPMNTPRSRGCRPCNPKE